jgi:hypothetical protein
MIYVYHPGYTSDSGRIYPLSRLKINISNPTLSIPSGISDYIAKKKGISLPNNLNPRYIIASLSDKSETKIEYPFRPDTPEWYDFWQQLTANPQIVGVKGFGERMIFGEKF